MRERTEMDFETVNIEGSTRKHKEGIKLVFKVDNENDLVFQLTEENVNWLIWKLKKARKFVY